MNNKLYLNIKTKKKENNSRIQKEKPKSQRWWSYRTRKNENRKLFKCNKSINE